MIWWCRFFLSLECILDNCLCAMNRNIQHTTYKKSQHSTYKKQSKCEVKCYDNLHWRVEIVFTNTKQVIYKVYKDACVHFALFREQLPNLREARYRNIPTCMSGHIKTVQLWGLGCGNVHSIVSDCVHKHNTCQLQVVKKHTCPFCDD